jgi:HAD superfamily hydrolase (TIGR01509 family)
MINVDAIIFDFDGVLLESEFEGNMEIARLLTELGYPHTPAEAIEHYTGLNGQDFGAAIERRIGAPVPPEFTARLKARSAAVLESGIAAVAGAIAFVRDLPRDLPKAVASSSSTDWISTHLRHLGLADVFGDHIYSGREHVERGKPAPDLYLYAAERLGVAIDRSVILEDSRVGVTGAIASGARVIGLAAGKHCFDGHADSLRDAGATEIAYSFDEVRQLVGFA